MKISLNWLKKFVDIKISDDELVRLIGARLVEVEGVIDETHKYDKIYVVKVVEAEKIPDTHLTRCMIDCGGDELVQVMCGAPNVHEGMLAAWIAPGAVVPVSVHEDAPFVIGTRKMLGKFDSHGMLAAADELDLGEDHEGIVEIDPEMAKAGDLLADVFELQDKILEIENKSLTHRPDCFGIIGFAREVAGILGQQFECGFSRDGSLAPVVTGLAPSFSVVTSESPRKKDFQAPLKIALIGRPNVGKSSLFNTLSKKQQAVVSSKQGTTRDVNRVSVKYKGRELEILDTAGLRKPGKREVGIEKFSAIRTLAAIEEADICCLLVDSTEPHSKLDQSLAGQIVEAGKGIIMVVTKSDLLEDAEPTNFFGEENVGNRTAADFLLDALEKDYNFLPYAPVVLTSSETGQNVTQLFELALEIDENRHMEVKTSELNKILNEAIISHPPAGLKNTRPKPKYIVQTDVCPPWFVVHGHDLGLLHWSWKRFLERKIREKYPFVGTPIMFSYRNDKN